jgi:hypothetical protein
MICNVCQQMFDHPVFLDVDHSNEHIPVTEQDCNWYTPFPPSGQENQPMQHRHSVRALQESARACNACFFTEQARQERLFDDGIDPDQDLDQKPFYCHWYGLYTGSSGKTASNIIFSYDKEFNFALKVSNVSLTEPALGVIY